MSNWESPALVAPCSGVLLGYNCLKPAATVGIIKVSLPAVAGYEIDQRRHSLFLLFQQIGTNNVKYK